MKIKGMNAVEILTTQGTFSVQVDLELENGKSFSASTGYGTSRGGHEMSIRGKIDKEIQEHRIIFSENQFDLIHKCIKINQAIEGKEVSLESIDAILCELDGTPDKSNLGMPLILATSMAVAKAESWMQDLHIYEYIGKKIGREDYEDYSLPVPLINMINGGVHSLVPTIPFQEILLIPNNDSEKNTSFTQSIHNAQKIFFELQKLLKKRSIFFGYGFEGGITAPFDSIEQVLDLLSESIANCNLSDSFSLGVDCAANQWYDQKLNRYSLFKNGKKYTAEQLIQWYFELSSRYKITYFEDPFAETDLEAWLDFADEFPAKGMVVGDDLCVTNVDYIAKAVEKNCIDSVIIKPSQVGTISQTIAAVKYAQENDLEIIVSHRSCETDETFIVDFALGVYADFCKFGNITQGNINKYNKLFEWDYITMCEVLKMTYEQAMSEKEEENDI